MYIVAFSFWCDGNGNGGCGDDGDGVCITDAYKEVACSLFYYFYCYYFIVIISIGIILELRGECGFAPWLPG